MTLGHHTKGAHGAQTLTHAIESTTVTAGGRGSVSGRQAAGDRAMNGVGEDEGTNRVDTPGLFQYNPLSFVGRL